VDLVESVGAQQESAAVVEPGEGSFDDPAVTAEMGAVLGQSASDQRFDAALPEQPAVLVVVVATIGNQGGWTPSWPTGTTAHRRHAIE